MTKFTGIFVPIITPFINDELDRASLKNLINYLIKEGVTGLIPCGTTGEAPPLSMDEHKEVIKITIDEVAGRVPVIAGAGSNETSKAIELTKYAETCGADGALIVCPYYNKPTQEGLIRHFTAISELTNIPIVLYNIPKRTGVNMSVETTLKLSNLDNIVGIKECGCDFYQIMEIIGQVKNFSVLSGEDALTFSICCLGGHGAIAASAHFCPSQWVKMCNAIKSGQIEEARRIHYKFLPLLKVLFSESNPAPLKAALKMLGIIATDEVRLPLVPASDGCKKRLEEELVKLKLL